MNSRSENQFIEAQKKHRKGDIHGALRIYDVILRSNNYDARTRIYRALALQQLGRMHESRQELLHVQKIISKPGVVELMMMGIMYRAQRMVSDAENAFLQGLKISPEHGPLLSNYAVLLMQLGRLDEAESRFISAAKIMVEDPAPYLNLARIYLIQQRYEEVEKVLDKVGDIDPGHPDYAVCRAMLSRHDGDPKSAYSFIIKALEKTPSHRVAWQELRGIPIDLVNISDINQAAKRLVALKPTSAALLSAAVGVCRSNLAWDALDDLEKLLSTALEHGVDEPVSSSAVFDLLATQISQEAHLQAARSCWRQITLGRVRKMLRPKPLESRALRIGYLSSDFRAHAVGTLLASVIEKHSHNGFEWYAYNNSPDDGSNLRKRFRLAFDRWINIFNTDDDELAERIRSDEIDLLVDLNGVTGGTRIQVLARGVAPVQITWLGMPGSVGADGVIDYQIVDHVMVDAKNIAGFHEKLVFLPRSYVPRDPQIEIDSYNASTRSEQQLPDDAIVYCSFNQPYKFSPETLDAWACILNAVENSVLWLMGRNETIESRFLNLLNSKGISPQRIVYAKSLPRPLHLSRLRLADLMLDNWPYNAGTTCTDALICGVPMLTLAGETFVSRVATSILKSATLDELATRSIDEYIEKATRFGLDPIYRNSIKNSVQERFLRSNVVDAPGMALHLETAYRAMVERSAYQLPPEHLHIKPDNSYCFTDNHRN